MTSNASKIALTALLLLVLASCKIVSTVPKNGSILAADGSVFCASGQICSVDVSDTFFDENFSALPETDYVFSMWSRDSLCAMTDRPCRIRTRGFDKFSELQRLLESSQKGQLDPIFSPLVQGLDCRDSKVPLDAIALVNNDPFLDFFQFDDCRFASDPVNRLFSGMTFWKVSAGQLPLGNGQGGWFGPGDVLVTIGNTEQSEAVIAPGRDAIVFYIDADDSIETGKSSHSVLGVDYRAWVSSCSYIDEVVFGQAEIKQFQGIVEYWSASRKRWLPVEDDNFGVKATNFFGSSDENWDIALLTGFGSESIGMPSALAVHVETLGAKCQLPQNPRIKFFAGVIKT